MTRFKLRPAPSSSPPLGVSVPVWGQGVDTAVFFLDPAQVSKTISIKNGLKPDHTGVRCLPLSVCDPTLFSLSLLPPSSVNSVLILQLKRFRFTTSFDLEKVDSPVALTRELGVDPESSCTKQVKMMFSKGLAHLCVILTQKAACQMYRSCSRMKFICACR